MSEITINSSPLGNSLSELLTGNDEITPGESPSYQLCKTIYEYHPLGAKIADYPVEMAQSQQREITVPKGPETRLKDAFLAEWKALRADEHILNTARLARVYGVASLAMLSEGTPSDRPVNFQELFGLALGFNVLDPLNTSGSLVLNQDPNAIDFQKVKGIAVAGQAYHPSRTVTVLNEKPIYIGYTNSAFGYVGRSIYQRGLFPLKSFIATMTTDDMVALKAGLLVAKIKQQTSAMDKLASGLMGQKREMLQQAKTGNVISVGHEDGVESLNLQNLDGAGGFARRNILENIASGCGTPAKVILAESFAEGFGEGTEDAKHIAQFINRLREWLQPLYDFFDKIVMHRAWNREFYATIQNDFPEYKKRGYTQAFYEWSNSFAAAWPSLIEEPESEKIKVADVKLKAVIAMLEVLSPQMDPENRVALVRWACDCFNDLKMLFPSPLVLDFEALENFDPAAAFAGEEGEDGEGKVPKPNKPFAAGDSASIRGLTEAVSRLVTPRLGRVA